MSWRNARVHIWPTHPSSPPLFFALYSPSPLLFLEGLPTAPATPSTVLHPLTRARRYIRFLPRTHWGASSVRSCATFSLDIECWLRRARRFLVWWKSTTVCSCFEKGNNNPLQLHQHCGPFPQAQDLKKEERLSQLLEVVFAVRLGLKYVIISVLLLLCSCSSWTTFFSTSSESSPGVQFLIAQHVACPLRSNFQRSHLNSKSTSCRLLLWTRPPLVRLATLSIRIASDFLHWSQSLEKYIHDFSFLYSVAVSPHRKSAHVAHVAVTNDGLTYRYPLFF